jgi:uncharacterized DUF497 family protein
LKKSIKVYTITPLRIDYDPAKSRANVESRGLSFERVQYFDFDTAKIWQDNRISYPEERYLALGYLENRLHVLCFTTIYNGIRIISFRKANNREGKKHGFALTRN